MKAKTQTRKALPGYQHRLFAAVANLAAMRGVSHAVVEHDHCCAIFHRHPCNCTPDISITHDGSVLVVDAMGAVIKSCKQ